MEHKLTRYPFLCSGCKKQVISTQAGKLAHSLGICSLKCKGIKRDSAGLPLDPLLRKARIESVKSKQQYNHQMRLYKQIETILLKLLKLQKSKRFDSTNFYNSKQWLELRFIILERYGRQCQLCGQKPPNVTLHVDHIIPISIDPTKYLDIENLQVLCESCNLGKANRSITDFRS